MTDLDKMIEAVEAEIIGPYHDPGAFKAVGFAQMTRAASAYRGSLDAAKALHDALLPGWWATIRYSTRPLVTVGDVEYEFRAQDDSPARAWLIAILRAYREQVQT